MTGHFWCWQKSPIAIKDFGGAVSPLIDPAFTGNFLHFNDKEVPGFQTINLFTLIKYFSQENIHPLPSCSQHPWNPRSSQANIPKGYTMSSNTNPLKNIIPLICKALILNKKQWFVEPQLTLHWLSESYTSKIDLAIKECKRFPLVMIKTGSFNKCCERF